MGNKVLPVLIALGGAASIGVMILADKRRQLIGWARSQIGASNGGVYWLSALEPGTPVTDYPKDWCGGFLLAGLHSVGLGKTLFWKIGDGFLIPNLDQTLSPKPGDIAYFDKNEHQALVTAVDSNGMVSLINGNGANGQVTTSTVPISTVKAFFSIDRLLKGTS
jgi:hypothetical protein